jgi:hypothetical protein
METLASGNAAPANADNTVTANASEADANDALATGDGSAPSAPEAGSPAPKKDAVQERIDKLTREKYDALRERDRQAYENERIQQRLAELEKAPTQQVAPANDFPTLEQYGYDESKFNAAVAAHIAKVTREQGTAAAQEAIRAEREAEQQRRVGESWAKKEAEFIKSKPDYLEKVRDNASLPITQSMAQLIKDSDVGPQVAYYLGENEAQAAAIARMPPLAQAREIGRIEARIEAEKAKPRVAVSQAPPPPPKIDAGDAQAEKSPSEMSDSEFAKWRKKQISARRNQ